MRIDLREPLQQARYLAELFGAKVGRCGTPSERILGITNDTAQVRRGDLFLAMKGESADGNEYIPRALAAGAVAILSERDLFLQAGDFWWFSCENVQDALLCAAGKWRQKCGAVVVAVTGSAGKTTTKEAIAAVLGGVAHNEGNYNSMVGMPLSVLSFPEEEFWVCELGINHVGEMEKMAKALRPDVGVITNVGSAHIGNFGDFSTTLKEKFMLCAGMDDEAKLVLPLSLKNTELPPPLCQVFYVGKGKTADFAMENIDMDESGTHCDLRHANGEITNLTWPMPGVIGSNVLGLSAAVGVLCGRTPAQIRAGVKNAAHISMHASSYPVESMLFLEDCYNASPEACLAAFEALRYLAPGRELVAVLGDMLELGQYSRLLHRTLGASVFKTGFSYLFTYGALAGQIALGAKEAGMPCERIFSFALGEHSLLAKSLIKHIPPQAAVLFKASRAVQMGRVAEEVRRLL